VKKPSNYMELNTLELSHHINALNNWNANQAMSDAKHNKHYRLEILPLVYRNDELWNAWVGKHEK